MDKNEIKKDLYKSKAMAKFTHYQGGNLYYSVELADGVYQFPIPTIEETTINAQTEDDSVEVDTIKLSSDLGTTPFDAEVRGSELSRWITKAIDKDEFIKIG